MNIRRALSPFWRFPEEPPEPAEPEDFEAIADQILANTPKPKLAPLEEESRPKGPTKRAVWLPGDPAKAYALGVEAGRESVSVCCGCTDAPIVSPYTGETL